MAASPPILDRFPSAKYRVDLNQQKEATEAAEAEMRARGNRIVQQVLPYYMRTGPMDPGGLIYTDNRSTLNMALGTTRTFGEKVVGSYDSSLSEGAKEILAKLPKDLQEQLQEASKTAPKPSLREKIIMRLEPLNDAALRTEVEKYNAGKETDFQQVKSELEAKIACVERCENHPLVKAIGETSPGPEATWKEHSVALHDAVDPNFDRPGSMLDKNHSTSAYDTEQHTTAAIKAFGAQEVINNLPDFTKAITARSLSSIHTNRYERGEAGRIIDTEPYTFLSSPTVIAQDHPDFVAANVAVVIQETMQQDPHASGPPSIQAIKEQAKPSATQVVTAAIDQKFADSPKEADLARLRLGKMPNERLGAAMEVMGSAEEVASDLARGRPELESAKSYTLKSDGTIVHFSGRRYSPGDKGYNGPEQAVKIDLRAEQIRTTGDISPVVQQEAARLNIAANGTSHNKDTGAEASLTTAREAAAQAVGEMRYPTGTSSALSRTPAGSPPPERGQPSQGGLRR